MERHDMIIIFISYDDSTYVVYIIDSLQFFDLKYVFIQSLCSLQDSTQGQLLSGVKSWFKVQVFIPLDWLLKLKDSSLSYYLPIAKRIDRPLLF